MTQLWNEFRKTNRKKPVLFCIKKLKLGNKEWSLQTIPCHIHPKTIEVLDELGPCLATSNFIYLIGWRSLWKWSMNTGNRFSSISITHAYSFKNLNATGFVKLIQLWMGWKKEKGRRKWKLWVITKENMCQNVYKVNNKIKSWSLLNNPLEKGCF
jgi:hypothetical protein